MLIPIALGLAWPDRVPGTAPAVDWSSPQTWEFFPLDDEAFPAVRLAREAGARGGTAPAVYNAANEVCVAGVPRRETARSSTSSTRWRRSLPRTTYPRSGDLTVDDVLAADAWARTRTATALKEQPLDDRA